MNKQEIIASISKKGNGEIYLGVVGAVRTGKSTFIKRFIENLVVPNIEDEFVKKQTLDEIPQSASGKTIMTTEPKFVPSSGALINVGDFSTNIKLVDCVGYIVPEANGFIDENGNPRMVKSPWYDEPITFIQSAETGTNKVIEDHATIGIVVTSDGSFGEIKRDSYIEAETKVISQLQQIGKPYIVLLNTATPSNQGTINLAKELQDRYDVPVMPIAIDKMNETEIMEILKTALYEFPVIDINISIPEWIHVLSNKHKIKAEYLDLIRGSITNIEKVKDVDFVTTYFENSEYISKAYISQLDAASGIITINLESPEELYNETLKETLGETIMTKASILKMFSSFKEGKEEYDSIKSALKMAKATGYGIMYPTTKDMKLTAPEVIKQGTRFGVKLKAVASSIHLVRVDVESTFEPIIGSELQSKELIDHLMKDYEAEPTNVWKSEIFGRSLEDVVGEGIKAKLSYMPDNTRYKLGDTITKIVNKGSNTLIALVL